MSYASLSNKINARLAPLAPTTVKGVYQFELQQAEAYPYITIVEDDTDEQEMPFDNMTDTIPYNFKVRVIDNSKDVPNTTANMRTLVDTILTTLREDLTWGCEVYRTRIGIKWGWME